jgi:hypothetical protein
MCLSTVQETFSTPKKVKSKAGPFRTGYKVINSVLKTEFGGVFYGAGYRFGVWHEANQEPITSTHFIQYQTGFHIFKFKKDAIKFHKSDCWSWHKIAKVQYQDVLAEGEQLANGDLAPCIVAAKMRVFKKDVEK